MPEYRRGPMDESRHRYDDDVAAVRSRVRANNIRTTAIVILVLVALLTVSLVTTAATATDRCREAHGGLVPQVEAQFRVWPPGVKCTYPSESGLGVETLPLWPF